MVDLVFRNITVHLETHVALRDVSLAVTPGKMMCVLGPNGAGKSTLLRAALGLIAPHDGQVLLDGQDPRRMAPLTRAHKIAYLPQMRSLAWPMRVRDVVALGRFAFGVAPGRLSQRDAQAVSRAIAACDLLHLQDRAANSLSGGEMARMHIARALAAETAMILADEPSAALDPLHAFQVMETLKEFCARGGGALVVTHDISLAARMADCVLLLRDGAVLGLGEPQDVLTPETMAHCFDVRAELTSGGGITILGPLTQALGSR